MAILTIDEHNSIKGYFSIKGNKDKSISYYIENKDVNVGIKNIFIVKDGIGYEIKDNLSSNSKNDVKSVCRGTIKNIDILKNITSTDNVGVGVRDTNGNIVFAEYFDSTKIDINSINIESMGKNSDINNDENIEREHTDNLNTNNCHINDNIDNHIEDMSENSNINNDENIKRAHTDNLHTNKSYTNDNMDNHIEESISCDDASESEKITQKGEILNPKKETTIYLSSKLEDSISFIDMITSRATSLKKTKTDNNEVLFSKFSYNIFKKNYIQNNQYYTATNMIVTLFKDTIKTYGHFILSVYKRKNNEIKFIQIGIPSMENELNLASLNGFKYTSLDNCAGGYWTYKFEV